jgi:hypothetical protein
LRKRLFRRHKHRYSFALQQWRLVDFCDIFELGNYIIHNLLPQFDMQHFAPPEHHSKLNAVAFLEKLPGMVQLCVAVMGVGLGPKANLLESNNVLLSDILFCLSFQFVQIFTEIHNPADRRLAVRRNFNQIKLRFFCQIQRFVNLYYANLIVFGINQTNGTCSNLFIDSKLQLCDGLTLS